MTDNKVNIYKYNLHVGVIGKETDCAHVVSIGLEIREENNLSFIRIEGRTPNNWESKDVWQELQRTFEHHPEDLYISRDEFVKLMDICENLEATKHWDWDQKWKPKETVIDRDNFLKSLRTPLKYLEIEKELDRHDDFYINDFDRSIEFKSTFKEEVTLGAYTDEYGTLDEGIKYSRYEIIYRIGDRNSSFPYYGWCQDDRSLSRRNVLHAFTSYVRSACSVENGFEAYHKETGEDEVSYNACLQAKFNLEESEAIYIHSLLAGLEARQRSGNGFLGVKTYERQEPVENLEDCGHLAL